MQNNTGRIAFVKNNVCVKLGFAHLFACFLKKEWEAADQKTLVQIFPSLNHQHIWH